MKIDHLKQVLEAIKLVDEVIGITTHKGDKHVLIHTRDNLMKELDVNKYNFEENYSYHD